MVVLAVSQVNANADGRLESVVDSLILQLVENEPDWLDQHVYIDGLTRFVLGRKARHLTDQEFHHFRDAYRATIIHLVSNEAERLKIVSTQFLNKLSSQAVTLS